MTRAEKILAALVRADIFQRMANPPSGMEYISEAYVIERALKYGDTKERVRLSVIDALRRTNPEIGLHPGVVLGLADDIYRSLQEAP